jgi:hypothetical protein
MNRNFTIKLYLNFSYTVFERKNVCMLPILICMGMFVSFGSYSQSTTTTEFSKNKISTDWASLTIYIMKNSPNGSPTFGSRFLGYTGLTMYESVCNGSKKHSSLAGKVNGLENLPKASKKTDWYIALNAGQAQIIKKLYGFTSASNLAKVDSLEAFYLKELSKGKSKKVIAASTAYGKTIADAIYTYSKTDGGHEAYKYILDSTFVIKSGNGLWTPPAKGQASAPLPLHPYWGNNRTFSKENFVLPIPDMISYDYKKGSEYYNYMKEVFDTRQNLTQEQKEIANWWGDDPSETFSPPGHSYYMAIKAVEISNADIFTASQSFSAVGMAVADAFVNCWKTKYHYNVERPFAFIFYNMSTLWDLYWPEPPFPAFYSGHAGQAASAATVLTYIYGNEFMFTDFSHVGRPKDLERNVEYKPRKFNSFFEAAEESAMSRLYGGIHTRLDNEVGLTEGKKIGANVLALYKTEKR